VRRSPQKRSSFSSLNPDRELSSDREEGGSGLGGAAPQQRRASLTQEIEPPEARGRVFPMISRRHSTDLPSPTEGVTPPTSRRGSGSLLDGLRRSSLSDPVVFARYKMAQQLSLAVLASLPTLSDLESLQDFYVNGLQAGEEAYARRLEASISLRPEPEDNTVAAADPPPAGEPAPEALAASAGAADGGACGGAGPPGA